MIRQVMVITPPALIAAIRAAGSEATDLRDAVHEAHHALESKTPHGHWDRETIHRHVMRLRRGEAAVSEVMARAVEQIVCARLGRVIDPIEKWAGVSCMEAIKRRIPFFNYEQMLEATQRALNSASASKAADNVMALAVTAAARKAPRRAGGSR